MDLLQGKYKFLFVTGTLRLLPPFLEEVSLDLSLFLLVLSVEVLPDRR